jgi:hypothetical protein
MKLYVCYGTWKPAPRRGGHPCGTAYHALREAGYHPDVIRSYGLGLLPDALNMTPGRREVKRLTGNNWVPVLVTDDGSTIQGSRRIAEWAKGNPAPARRVTGAVAARPDEPPVAGRPDEPPVAARPDEPPVAGRPGFSLADFERWVDHGADWRALEISDERAVLELRTCYGEPVEMVESRDRGLIERIRAPAED